MGLVETDEMTLSLWLYEERRSRRWRTEEEGGYSEMVSPMLEAKVAGEQASTDGEASKW